MTETITLTETPKNSSLFVKAALGAIPVPGLSNRPSTLPDRVVKLQGLRVDPDHLSAYCRATGLRFGDALPLTYPFILSFPLAMQLVVARDFPFVAVGAVHAQNLIERTRDISVSEPLDFETHIENLREHPKGLLVDAVTAVSVGREQVWRQVTTFLHQQRTSLSGGPKPEPKPDEVPPPPMRQTRVDQQMINRYAAASGDHNPIHTSALGAKAFGFPKPIAHGMWSAANVLANIEGRVPGKATYDVKFGKPILLPSTVNVYADQVEGGWDLALRHPKKGYPHLTATLR
ncbi:dehydratase [Nocardia otitidiscaviarum]|uniref:Bifunctional enoyl-CoA hydratase/phosphate acetyltransferase n=1 Tax=Nocardia otitidiscaviarum TaxID=1823 RepID=A0A378YBF5_9NOCA|nr:MaoC/PaaZ C-terminal domain-containing protein [Nocardia otitidiscaviarum]MBF6137074.1 dehydratase [Nocardia otitidiscaviarum]MBF6183241.1 dehydratase [Nocardia otitidiscaviarum]MBF6237680.1 dehydratase [Nocardia otitidiscaviarum]MBF6487973.1 dehydratase [Nocardia otitidiscaviarum]MCP9622240.1 dehydratase [Nocardia otitidiscaviarum]